MCKVLEQIILIGFRLGWSTISEVFNVRRVIEVWQWKVRCPSRGHESKNNGFNSLTKCLWSTLIANEIKLRVYQSALRLLMMYGSQSHLGSSVDGDGKAKLLKRMFASLITQRFNEHPREKADGKTTVFLDEKLNLGIALLYFANLDVELG
ncbi:hypothetical protein RB195_014190 [Necator americanus]|uniref:Uncharacterized protein n=1 Tax=Necator americanus TaxID=51031 RepID=A0ABR1DZ22_NECAM